MVPICTLHLAVEAAYLVPFWRNEALLVVSVNIGA